MTVKITNLVTQITKQLQHSYLSNNYDNYIATYVFIEYLNITI